MYTFPVSQRCAFNENLLYGDLLLDRQFVNAVRCFWLSSYLADTWYSKAVARPIYNSSTWPKLEDLAFQFEFEVSAPWMRTVTQAAFLRQESSALSQERVCLAYSPATPFNIHRVGARFLLLSNFRGYWWQYTGALAVVNSLLRIVTGCECCECSQ